MLLQESIGQERRPLSWVVGEQGVYRAEMPSQKEQRREQRIQVTNLRSPTKSDPAPFLLNGNESLASFFTLTESDKKP